MDDNYVEDLISNNTSHEFCKGITINGKDRNAILKICRLKNDRYKFILTVTIKGCEKNANQDNQNDIQYTIHGTYVYPDRLYPFESAGDYIDLLIFFRKRPKIITNIKKRIKDLNLYIDNSPATIVDGPVEIDVVDRNFNMYEIIYTDVFYDKMFCYLWTPQIKKLYLQSKGDGSSDSPEIILNYFRNEPKLENLF